MAKTVAYVFGAVLAVVGIWGFIQNPVLGIFSVNGLHNLVHLASGVVLLGVAMWWEGSTSMALIVLGIVYALVAVLGFVAPDLMFSLLNSGTEDTWLHVALAIVFLGAGFMGRGENSMGASMGAGM